MAAFDLKYYADVFLRIDDIFVRLLNRPADMGGLVNWFWHWRENGASFEWIEDQIKASPEYAEVHKPRPNLPRLVNRGGFFATETGERFTVIGCSDFNLFTSYLMMGHQYARDIMAERSAIGFNWLRVWLAYWDTNTNGGIPGIGKLNPADHSGMYGRLAPFCAIASEYGLYVELTAFTGPHIPGHWEAIGAALQGVQNVAVELCNENNAHAVNINPDAYQPLPGILCSHGSNASRNTPPRPWWGYENMHHVNIAQWPRQVGHNSLELTIGDPEGHITPSRVPCISDENTRPDQDANIDHFYDAAASAALLCGGSTFHSQSGKASVPFDARDRQFAEAWVAGAKSVPLEFQDGVYRHAAELEPPGDWQFGARTYQRVLPDGRRHTVAVRK
jgi:hypothetical protein